MIFYFLKLVNGSPELGIVQRNLQFYNKFIRMLYLEYSERKRIDVFISLDKLNIVSEQENMAERYRGDALRLIRSISIGNIDPRARQYSFHTRRFLTYLKNARIIETSFTHN